MIKTTRQPFVGFGSQRLRPPATLIFFDDEAVYRQTYRKNNLGNNYD